MGLYQKTCTRIPVQATLLDNLYLSVQQRWRKQRLLYKYVSDEPVYQPGHFRGIVKSSMWATFVFIMQVLWQLQGKRLSTQILVFAFASPIRIAITVYIEDIDQGSVL